MAPKRVAKPKRKVEKGEGYPRVGPSAPLTLESTDADNGRKAWYNKEAKRMEMVWPEWAVGRPEYDLRLPGDAPWPWWEAGEARHKEEALAA